MSRHLLSTFISLVLFIGVLASDREINVPLRFDHYYTYDEVNRAMEALADTYPELCTVEEIGKSEEGRKILALTINNPKTGKHNGKPGIYVDGNIHGNEIQAGEVCLYLADYLLQRHGKNETITSLIDRSSFYIIPVVNVDGRWHFFEDANTPSTNRSIRIPKDDDGDGLFDEDGYDDLDGDGNICLMRIKDPNGSYKVNPEDPRLLDRVKPEEKGEYTILGYEGIDNDGDGRFNEDAEGYVDPNRNWPYNWYPNFIQRGAGDYPLSGVGLKSIAEFIEERENILMAWAFHNYGGMFLRGPSSKDLVVPKEDITVYDLLGKNAEKMVPGYVYKPSYELYPTFGDFGEFTYNMIGAYTFIGELFQVGTETFNKDGKKAEDRTQQNLERLEFNDHLAHGELYKEWETYEHPVYGEIEIGGWVKFSSRLSHLYMLPDLIHRNASAVIYSAQQLPEVEMEVFETEKLQNGLQKVRIRLKNTKGISTMSMHSWENKLYPPDMIKVSNAEVIAGGKVINRYTNEVKYKEHKPEIQFTRISGFDKVEYEFLIKGKGSVNIDFISRKAANKHLTIEF